MQHNIPSQEYLDNLRQKLQRYHVYALTYIRQVKTNRVNNERAFFHIEVPIDSGDLVPIARTIEVRVTDDNDEIVRQANRIIERYQLPIKRVVVQKLTEGNLEKIIEEIN